MTSKHELQSVTNDDVWWSVDKAALHLGVTVATIKRYIRGGLPTRFGLVHRVELLAEYRRRVLRQTASRVTREEKSSQ